MQQMYLISIIIPVYNVEQYLRKCLDSVINQTYKNLEIIIVDDGSTDNSGKICDEYSLKDNRITVIHKKNEGVSSARNIGLDIVSGDYIGFVDSDDYIENDMYETLLSVLLKEKSQLIVCNWFEEKGCNWVENKNFPIKEKLTINEALEYFYKCMNVWSKLFSRNILKDVRFDENCGYGEDILFVFEAFKRVKNICCINTPKYYYRIYKYQSYRFKKIYLRYLDIVDIEIDYAQKNKLLLLEKKLYAAKYTQIAAWLGLLSLDNNPDREIIQMLLDIMKKNLISYLLMKDKVQKKIFIVVACVNFNLARLIYRLILKLKG